MRLAHFAYLLTLVYLDMPLHTFVPLRTLACLNILLAESTKGTPGVPFSSCCSPAACLFIVHGYVYHPYSLFATPSLDQKSNKRNSRNVHKYNGRSFNMSKTRRSTANPNMPRTTHRALREHREQCDQGSSAHDVLVLQYKDFLTDSEYLIS